MGAYLQLRCRPGRGCQAVLRCDSVADAFALWLAIAQPLELALPAGDGLAVAQSEHQCIDHWQRHGLGVTHAHAEPYPFRLCDGDADGHAKPNADFKRLAIRRSHPERLADGKPGSLCVGHLVPQSFCIAVDYRQRVPNAVGDPLALALVDAVTQHDGIAHCLCLSQHQSGRVTECDAESVGHVLAK